MANDDRVVNYDPAFKDKFAKLVDKLDPPSA
jgi:hypothetical protein